MINSPFYLISIVFSTLLAFFTMAALVEIVLNALDRKKYRTRFLMRLIPYGTLLMDRIFGCFSLGNWFNPLNCESCVQKVVLEAYYPDLQQYLSENQVSLLRHLSFENSHMIFGVVFYLFFGISLFKLAQVVYQSVSVNRALQGLKNHREEYLRPIQNKSLQGLLGQYQAKIWVTSEVSGPMVAWNKDIYLPKEIAAGLDQQEFESILAHEMEHVRWKDSWVNLVLRGIAAAFWWIPMESWYRSVEQDQEMACDAKVVRYDLEEEYLASALVKVSKELKIKSVKAFCYFAKSSGRTKNRLEALLSDAAPYKITGYYCLTVLLATLILLVCFILKTN
jgi:beta-lactamase regulating signal transducer with metallopeptidase domain